MERRKGCSESNQMILVHLNVRNQTMLIYLKVSMDEKFF